MVNEDKPKVLGETYEEGKPKDVYRWRKKLRTRKDMLDYLKTAERYWFAKKEDIYGSEKRKTEA